MDNRKWERRVGGWGEGRQGEGKGIEERAEIHKERRRRETKLTKKGEISKEDVLINLGGCLVVMVFRSPTVSVGPQKEECLKI
jgi:hypothetical protein